MSANERGSRGERFWSNSSFMFGETDELALAVGGERQAGLNIFGGEVREVRENLRLAHAAREVFQHVRYRHARSANSRFPAALARFDADDLAVIHGGMITK